MCLQIDFDLKKITDREKNKYLENISHESFQITVNRVPRS